MKLLCNVYIDRNRLAVYATRCTYTHACNMQKTLYMVRARVCVCCACWKIIFCFRLSRFHQQLHFDSLPFVAFMLDSLKSEFHCFSRRLSFFKFHFLPIQLCATLRTCWLAAKHEKFVMQKRIRHKCAASMYSRVSKLFSAASRNEEQLCICTTMVHRYTRSCKNNGNASKIHPIE